MKTLVVLTALAAVALAGPTFRADDTDFDVTNVQKRSPTLQSLHHHHIPSPVHIAPVHHSYVQPIVPHHLGLKKPLFIKKPYGHFRSEDEQPEIHSAESKESKNKCMKEMEAKCDDDIIAKSSETDDATKVEDIDGNVSESEVAQSLQMAKDAVDELERKLQLAEKNSRMTQWKHGQSEADGRMHENVEAAKLALEHMQRNFGNLESMNVHARAFKNAAIEDVNLELKSEVERLAQWKNAMENIQKNVELVRNIEDSFQHNQQSEKSAALPNSNLKPEIKDDAKQDINELKKEKTNGKRTSDTMKKTQEMEEKSTDGKSSWKAREHEQSSNVPKEMETSASTMSESKTTFHNAQEQQSTSQIENSSASEIPSASNARMGNEHDNIKMFKDDERSVKMSEDKKISQPMETHSQASLKSSDNLEMTKVHFEREKSAPIVDTTSLMKAAEHSQAEQHSKKDQHSSTHMEHSSHKEHSAHMDHTSQKGHDINSLHLEHQRSSTPALQVSSNKYPQQLNLHVEHPKAKESESFNHQESSIPAMHSKDAHEMMMKSSDQMTGQSQQAGVAVKPSDHMILGHHSEKLHHSSSHGAHGKSSEDGSLFAPIEMNSAFQQSLLPTKLGKEAQAARGAYGSGVALGGSYGSGYGAGSGAVGVFPNAHVGGCAIPLLLSCSPSVVAGKLAKGHSYGAPSYAAPAYRGAENTNSHSKRDITKISRPYKANRTPTNKDLKQKSILITDKL